MHFEGYSTILQIFKYQWNSTSDTATQFEDVVGKLKLTDCKNYKIEQLAS